MLAAPSTIKALQMSGLPSTVARPARASGAACLRRALQALALACLTWAQLAAAAPFVPQADDQVLERLPSKRDSPEQRELSQLRSALRSEPSNPERAVALAQRLYEAWSADGDPRHLGHAQAALAPWWNSPTPPLPVRVMRAVLRQLNHEFDAALVDLRAAVREDPDAMQAWAWIAAVALVQADHAQAAAACAELARMQQEPVASGCAAQVQAATGQAEAATRQLQQALQAHDDADPKLRVWLLTRLAETEERLARHADAEASFRRALTLGQRDGYLLAAYADFLLDRGRPAEVLALLKDSLRSDVLLLRLAIAAKLAKSPQAAAHEAALLARFDAARARGDTVHRKEEARFWLEVRPDPARALPLAMANFAQQRELADAQLLMQAALAAQTPKAAEPALAWMRLSRVQAAQLQSLVQRLTATLGSKP